MEANFRYVRPSSSTVPLAFCDLPVEVTSRPGSLSLLALHASSAGVKPGKFYVSHMITVIAVALIRMPLMPQRWQRYWEFSLVSSAQRNNCSAGDSAAYERRGAASDDIVVVSALRTPITKACFLPQLCSFVSFLSPSSSWCLSRPPQDSTINTHTCCRAREVA